MNFTSCLQYLDRLGNEVLTMKLGLENIRRLLAELDNPHREFPSILVAGTNGKGSTARFLASILHHSGYRTGLYTSPHLVGICERIAVDGRPVSRESFAECFTQVTDTIRSAAFEHHPTYFETVTATGFLHFSKRDVEVAVLEVGLGGRLDSTNVVLPKLSIITPIGLDHTDVLGSTLESIAAEKGGVIHQRRPVVLASQPEPAARVLRRLARDRQAPVTKLDLSELSELEAGDGRYRFVLDGQQYQLSGYGKQQVDNAALAIRAGQILKNAGFLIRRERLPAAIQAVRPYSVLRRLGDSPALYVDGGHNPDAARRLREFVENHTSRPRSLVLGMMRDKSIAEVARILISCFDRIYLTRIDYPRAASLEQLQQAIPEGKPMASWREALQTASQSVETVIVTGSFYLIGEVVEQLAGPTGSFWDIIH